MTTRYFDIKESHIPNGLDCNNGSRNFVNTRCIVSAIKHSDAEALSVKGTELTKVQARALRLTWDEDFPSPS